MNTRNDEEQKIDIACKLDEFKKRFVNKKPKDFSFKVLNNLYEKIDKHIHILKCLKDRSQSKQRWIVEAIHEKLKEEENQPNEQIPRAKTLHVCIQEDVLDRIQSRVETIKKFRTSFSKKLWILEAIYAKLDKEESNLNKLFEELNTSPKDK